ncbi:hypothetical protein B0O99DRAFT_609282 [Bisporella sp. PMI_857]|nr:hypothetical protein B0O99DRAFT_609282 [Bisporella sp. PMI_857]
MPYPLVPPKTGFGFTKITHSATYPAIGPIKADLTGEIVFITGASNGVGRQTAISYAKAGASVVIGARSDLASLETELHSVYHAVGRNTTKVLKIKLDVLDQSSVDEAAKQIGNEFGYLDILINNAGYLSTFLPVADTEPLDWWQNMEVNVRGVYWMTRACLPLLLKGGDKTVINLTSIGALALTPGASGYQTSKFAVIRFMEYLCVEYADRGLLAYSIHPGGVATELALKMPKQIHSGMRTCLGIMRQS